MRNEEDYSNIDTSYYLKYNFGEANHCYEVYNWRIEI